ncbi:LPS export ABC transporter permease LptF [Alteromonadaceae bacterium M269]|nr:LPS export ABC transporter permease LptF [Alteromonadaceae bacterium M269]
MLILRYLLKETIKSQLAVFLILMAIFITQKFVKVLEEASDGEVPAGLVLGFLALNVPILGSFILPLSLFLGIMLAHGRLYVDSEMVVMRACGISEWYITRIMLLLAFLVGLVCASLTLYLAPLAVETEYQLEEQVSAESGLTTLIPGRFQQTANRKAVMFVHDIESENNELKQVFLAQHDKPEDDEVNAEEEVHIVYAQTGNVVDAADGSQKLILREGMQYEGKEAQPDFHVIAFDEYQIQIAEQQAEQKRRKLTAYPTKQLIGDTSTDAIAELQWRIAIPLSLPFLVLIAVPLSAVDPRQGRFGKMFPALLLYIGYFLLLMAGRKVLEDGKIPTALGLWWIHAIMLLIGSILIMKNRSIGAKVHAKITGRS